MSLCSKEIRFRIISTYLTYIRLTAVAVNTNILAHAVGSPASM